MELDFDKLWGDALSTFHATTDKRLDDKLLPKMITIEDLKHELTKEQASFDEFRKRRQALVRFNR